VGTGDRRTQDHRRVSRQVAPPASLDPTQRHATAALALGAAVPESCRAASREMNDPVEALVTDLLEWIGPRSRPYPEVLEAWRTSCPRLPVWEEANARGFIDHQHPSGGPAMVSLSAAGRAHLAQRRNDPTPR